MSQVLNNQSLFEYQEKRFENNKLELMSNLPNPVSDLPHVCEYCGKGYCRKDRLDRHKLTHSGDKPHKCEFCGKGYCRKDHLDRHRITHSGDKPHHCRFCEKKFFRKDHLDKHERTHLSGKLYACEYCGKEFTLKLNIDQHKLTHTSSEKLSGSTGTSGTVKCDVCGKNFTKRSLLDLHKMSSSDNDKMHVCSYCSKGYPSECELNRHLASTHSSIAINNEKSAKIMASSSHSDISSKM